MTAMVLDINCDLGEIMGNEGLALDRQMMDCVTSINIACGGHAGDSERMGQLAREAIAKSIRIGAHPSFPDRVHFGRREMQMKRTELQQTVVDQVGELDRIVRFEGGRLIHVKPHGALYNLAARDPETASIIAEGIASYDCGLVLVGLAGSASIDAGIRCGLKTSSEGFSDRHYRSDGSLVSRMEPKAILHDPAEILLRLEGWLSQGRVQTLEGDWIELKIDTLCIHSDTENAVAIAQTIRHYMFARIMSPK